MPDPETQQSPETPESDPATEVQTRPSGHIPRKLWEKVAIAAAVITGVGTLFGGTASLLGLISKPPVQEAGDAAAVSDPPATSSVIPSPLPTLTSLDELADIVAETATMYLPSGEEAFDEYDIISTTSSSMKVPMAWVDRENSIWAARDRQAIGEMVGASEDWSKLHDQLDVPGLMLASSAAELVAHELVESKVAARAAACQGGDLRQFSGDGYIGEFRLWDRCGAAGEGSLTLDFVAQDTEFLGMIMIFARLTDRRDVEAFRTALGSLETYGPDQTPEKLQLEVNAAEALDAGGGEGGDGSEGIGWDPRGPRGVPMRGAEWDPFDIPSVPPGEMSDHLVNNEQIGGETGGADESDGTGDDGTTDDGTTDAGTTDDGTTDDGTTDEGTGSDDGGGGDTVGPTGPENHLDGDQTLFGP
jgi:hypothetical protein